MEVEMFDWPGPTSLPDWKILNAVERHNHRWRRTRNLMGAMIIVATWLGILGLVP